MTYNIYTICRKCKYIRRYEDLPILYKNLNTYIKKFESDMESGIYYNGDFNESLNKDRKYGV